MTAEPSAGAASHIFTDWHAIAWKKVNEHVRRLQARIVQATKAGKWHKVQALQHLLTHSFSGKALAVRRVTENQGKNTPGVDTVTWKDPESKGMAIHQMQQRGYKALPLRRVYIPKSNGKKRPLGLRRCRTELCKRYTCKPWSPSLKRSPTQTPMGLGRNGVVPTPWSNAQRCSRMAPDRNGYWKGTSNPAWIVHLDASFKNPKEMSQEQQRPPPRWRERTAYRRVLHESFRMLYAFNSISYIIY
jgi:N-terminal domain of reverse transcriptase